MTIGLIIIGDEILSGRRSDQHFAKVVQLLAARGLQLGWAEILGDDPARITATLKRTFASDDIVFCCGGIGATPDRKSTRLNSSHITRSYAVFCLKKKNSPIPGAKAPDAERATLESCTRQQDNTPWYRFFFFFNDTATTEIYTLSLHDALPIYCCKPRRTPAGAGARGGKRRRLPRSEEHTSELQSHHDLVCRLLLEKKKEFLGHRFSKILRQRIGDLWTSGILLVKRLIGRRRVERQFFFFNDTATTEIYTLSLHDALPI